MKKSTRSVFYLLAILSLVNVNQVLAQSPQVTIFGKVVDAHTGEPLIGASLLIEGSTTGTTTSVDGSYSLLWHQDERVVLVCSYTGYATEKQTVDILYKREVELNFMLNEGVELEEVVVVGYAVPMVEADHTSMGMTISGKESAKRTTEMKDALSARVAGVASDSKGRKTKTRGSRSDMSFSALRKDMPKTKGVSEKSDLAKVGKMKKRRSTEEYSLSSVTLADEAEVIAPEVELSAGTLTAGEIHDFSKWELWQDIAAEDLHQWQNHWNFKLTHRYAVQVMNEEGFPIVGAKVNLEGENQTIWKTTTDNTGKAELWNGVFVAQEKMPTAQKITVTYEGNRREIQQLIPFNQGINFLKMDVNCTEKQQLDIAFVVDATGSMGDEIAYLQTELRDVIEKIQAERQDLVINLGSVFYKDKTDEYVTRKEDFTTDIGKAVQFMQAQKAGGGGDYPEAVDAALDMALNQLKWSDKTIAKLLFLVLDAPPHHSPEILEKLKKLTQIAAEKGVRIIPIAGSGIDKSTEYLMRSLALCTNGTYVFLTDHSGVGNPHIEPTTDEYEVEKLNDLLVRLIGQFTTIAKCNQPIAAINLPNIIEKQPENTVKCYPNPTTGIFKVSLETAVKELFLTDMSGKILLRFENLSAGETTVNLANFPNGTYFIRFSEADKLRTGRVVLAY